jgi:hypothetical protein
LTTVSCGSTLSVTTRKCTTTHEHAGANNDNDNDDDDEHGE